MLCQICKKNPATIHIQEIVNGKRENLHLCLSCAGKKTLANAMFDGMDLSNILESLEQNLASVGLAAFKTGGDYQEAAEKRDEPEHLCKTCAWSEAQFRKTGKLGCPDCYDEFYEAVLDDCLRHHRAATHTGMLPAVPDAEPPLPCGNSVAKKLVEEKQDRQAIETLEQDLQESVRREEYELAAELRDKIAAIKAKLSNSVPHEDISK